MFGCPQFSYCNINKYIYITTVTIITFFGKNTYLSLSLYIYIRTHSIQKKNGRMDQAENPQSGNFQIDITMQSRYFSNVTVQVLFDSDVVSLVSLNPSTLRITRITRATKITRTTRRERRSHFLVSGGKRL